MLARRFYKSLLFSSVRSQTRAVPVRYIYQKGTNLNKQKYTKDELIYQIEALALVKDNPGLSEEERALMQLQYTELKKMAKKRENQKEQEDRNLQIADVFEKLTNTETDHILERYKSKKPVRVLFITRNASRTEKQSQTVEGSKSALSPINLREKIEKKLEIRYPQTGVLQLKSKEGKLKSYVYPAEGSLKKEPILMIHGFGQHSQIDAHVAAELAASGFQVFAYDWRGHGQSQGARFKIEKLEDVYEDALQVVEQILKETNQEQLIIHGFSLGGAIGLKLAAEREHQIKAVVACNPLLEPTKLAEERGQGILSKVTQMFSRKKERLFIEDEETRQLLKKDGLLLSSNPDEKTVLELFRASSYFEGLEMKMKLPFLLLVGEADRVANVRRTRAFFKGADKVEDKQILEYSEVGHLGYLDLLNGDMMVQDVINFCVGQSSKQI